MTLKIVFETHAITTDNERGVATGWLAGRLSSRGREAATELGRGRIGDAGFDLGSAGLEYGANFLGEP
jgi:2,3-bisphosphoglycerate-dependent phosphoglycerate mutase